MEKRAIFKNQLNFLRFKELILLKHQDLTSGPGGSRTPDLYLVRVAFVRLSPLNH